MENTIDTTRNNGFGRNAAAICEGIRESLRSGKIPSGSFLPSVRDIGDEFGVSAGTAWRALKALESEGLITAQPRQGFVAVHQSSPPERGMPIAFLAHMGPNEDSPTSFSKILMNSLQHEAARHNWSILTADLSSRSTETVIAELRRAEVWGAVVDVHSVDAVAALKNAGIAVVMVDAWHPGSGADAVVQDGFQGGLLAGQYLAGRGHTRVAWLGSIVRSVHSMTRFGGAMTGLMSRGISIPPELLMEDAEEDTAGAVRLLLSRTNRPTAILGLWRDLAVAAAGIAVEQGLTLGTDLEIVGWCTREQYDRDYLPFFPGGYIPPTILWQVQTLAQAAMERLAERYAHPDLPPMRINIETSFLTSEHK